MKREHRTNHRLVTGLVTLAALVSACGGSDDGADAGESAVDQPSDEGSSGESSTNEALSDDASSDASSDLETAAERVTPDDVEAEGTDTASDEPTGAQVDAAPNEAATADEAYAETQTTEEFIPEAPEGIDAEDSFVDEPSDRDRGSFDGAVFEDYGQRTFVDADQDPLSTFSLDVDTGSYSITRAAIDNGALPPVAAIRPEEFINAFRYGYDTPDRGLAISIDGAPSPFDADSMLVRVGVSSEVVDERPPVALTFIVDTSGSMDQPDRLGLVKESLEILVGELDRDDTVAIVTYSDESGIVLRPTPASEVDEILDAIDDLEPGGSTNLEAGLATGYEFADEAYRDDGVNRVVLASDGIANVGLTDPDGLAAMIRDRADRGINLVTLGFGMGGYNDVTMEQIANNGDGFYAYIDTDDEAERLFADELTATLVTVAKDAKIQVEFDDERVAEYRLIGYENRGVADADFRNDDVDAGELGSGHEATAIYELRLRNGADGELGEVNLRWEDPDSGEVIEIDEDIDRDALADDWTDADDSLRLATIVTGFAELLRYNEFATDFDLDDVADAADDLADDLDDERIEELADLIAEADDLR